MDYDHIKLISCLYQVMVTNDTYLIMALQVIFMDIDCADCLEKSVTTRVGFARLLIVLLCGLRLVASTNMVVFNMHFFVLFWIYKCIIFYTIV